MTDLWLIDLDDTLYRASGGMFHEVHLRMNRYIVDHLGLSWDEASALRTTYWAKYGTTFLGLWKNHGTAPDEFLSYAHGFDPVPYISWRGDPARDLRRLSGKKVLFTNGPRPYAEAVLSHMGLSSFFDGLETSSDMFALGQWRPKPSALMMHLACRRYGAAPARTVLVDDTLMNLKCASAAGLRTVWCRGYRKTSARTVPSYVDRTVGHICELQALRF